jgi:UPF0755 protein
MSEEHRGGGFAPEPPGTYGGDPLSDPLSHPRADPLSDPLSDPHWDPLTAPLPGRHAPGYAGRDTGTRAVPIVRAADQAGSADDAASEEPDARTGYEPTYQQAEPDYRAAEPTYQPAHPPTHERGSEPTDPTPVAPDHEGYLGVDAHSEGTETGEQAILPMRGGRRASRRTGRRGLPGCLAAVVAMAIVLALLWVGGSKGYHLIKDHLGGSVADYAGPGTGSVTFEVEKGDSATLIGRHLKAAGVVQSVDAFIDAARSNPDSGKIQVGFYQLKKQMKAADALAVLVNPKSLVQNAVVVPEGARVDQIVASIVAKTDLKRADLVAALKDPSALGLPAAAKGNPEGYLFPATYTVAPAESATDLLKEMVAKGVQVRKELHLDTAAASVGLSPEQVVTVASILEYEAKRPEDYPKVARTIYNRLKAGMPLQSDATVSYANKVSGEVWTTAEMRANDSPYNTYQHTGLPPGPIGNPGEATLKAALNPASGSWLYWVVVNLKTGETVFSNTLAEHNAAVQRFQDYCKTSDAC